MVWNNIRLGKWWLNFSCFWIHTFIRLWFSFVSQMGSVFHLSSHDRRRCRPRGWGCGQWWAKRHNWFFSTNILRPTEYSKWNFCVAEYQLAKPSDSHRKEMLFGSLAKPDHPMSKFCWGKSNTSQSLSYKAALDLLSHPLWFVSEHWLLFTDRSQIYFSFLSVFVIVFKEMHRRWRASLRKRTSTCTRGSASFGRGTTLPTIWP